MRSDATAEDPAFSPSLPGESSEVSQPKPSPLATPVLPSPGASPTAGPGASPTRGPTPAPTETAAPEPEGPIEYTVVEGDTWFGIAGAFGVDAADLAAVNGRTLDDFIQPGQVLTIPQ